MVEQRTTRITKFRVVPWEDVLWPSDGLISWWKLNGNANDAWGTNHGTAYGVTWLPKGAGSFDGVDDYVEVPNDPSYAQLDSFTLEFWTYEETGTVQDGTRSGVLFAAQAYEYNGYGLWWHGKGEARWFINSPYQYITVPRIKGSWVHQVLVYNKRSQQAIAYQNTREVGTLSLDTSINTPASLQLMRNPFRGSYTEGVIDEVRIYKRALSADEIKKRYLKTRIVPLEVGV